MKLFFHATYKKYILKFIKYKTLLKTMLSKTKRVYVKTSVILEKFPGYRVPWWIARGHETLQMEGHLKLPNSPFDQF